MASTDYKLECPDCGAKITVAVDEHGAPTITGGKHTESKKKPQRSEWVTEQRRLMGYQDD
jgi:hypothetical protein